MSLSHRTDQILTPFLFFGIQSDWNIIKMIEIKLLFLDSIQNPISLSSISNFLYISVTNSNLGIQEVSFLLRSDAFDPLHMWIYLQNFM